MGPFPRWGAMLMTVVVATLWWFVAASTEIGEVVVELPGDSRGLHEGDVLALLLCVPPVVLAWLGTRRSPP